MGVLKRGKWAIVKSSPINKTPLLKSILTNRFPEIHFRYLRFSRNNFGGKSQVRETFDGVVVELKKLSVKSLDLYDNLRKFFGSSNLILILSPDAYQLLNQRRKKSLNNCMLVLSEMKSLDYLAQLPRLMEEVALRHQLRAQNEKLTKLIENHSGDNLGFDETMDSEILSDKIIPRLIRSDETQSREAERGLRVRIKNWSKTKSQLNTVAQSEIMNVVSRQLSQAVRASDRVLRSQDDEFLIFLSNIDSGSIKRCVERVTESIRDVSVQLNSKELRLPFAVQTVDELRFNS